MEKAEKRKKDTSKHLQRTTKQKSDMNTHLERIEQCRNNEYKMVTIILNIMLCY